jgi:hypothetical protein
MKSFQEYCSNTGLVDSVNTQQDKAARLDSNLFLPDSFTLP